MAALTVMSAAEKEGIAGAERAKASALKGAAAPFRASQALPILCPIVGTPENAGAV